jgi:DNA-binding response OmpR family regulator
MPTTQKKKILVVCSDKKNKALLRSILAEKNLTIIKAESKEKAIEAAENDNPDLVIYDFDISEFGGGDLASSIREKQPDKATPIIFITSLVSEAEQKCSLLGGPLCFLSKPLNVKRLLEEIERLLFTFRVQSLDKMYMQKNPLDSNLSPLADKSQQLIQIIFSIILQHDS